LRLESHCCNLRYVASGGRGLSSLLSPRLPLSLRARCHWRSILDEQEEPQLVPRRRLIILVVEQGEEIEMDYDGQFALWEVRAALEEAMEWIQTQILDEYAAELKSDESDDEGDDE
jgi:hypothetical protein